MSQIEWLSDIQLITFDLDDTLWPLMPTVINAEKLHWQWLKENAAEFVSEIDRERMMAEREQVILQHPQQSQCVSWLRQQVLRNCSLAAGYSQAAAEELVAQAFQVFIAARSDVQLYPDSENALQKLSERWPLAAITNGNANVYATALGQYMQYSVSPTQAGLAKPAAAIYELACQLRNVQPAQVLHVGDNLETDIQGANDAGMRTAWIARETVFDQQARQQHVDCDLKVDDLNQLLERLLPA